MLVIPFALVNQMQAHLHSCLPNEGCGLVLGSGYTAELVRPITNILVIPTLFRMDAQELLSALREIEDSNQVLLAIYHSHPIGECSPSPTDLEDYQYPEAAMLVFSHPERWKMMAFKIKDGVFEQIPLQLA